MSTKSWNKNALALLSGRRNAHLRKLDADDDVLIKLQKAMQSQFNALVMEELQLASIYRDLEHQRTKCLQKSSHSDNKLSKRHPHNYTQAKSKGAGSSKTAKTPYQMDGDLEKGREDSAGQWVLDEPMDLSVQNKLELNLNLKNAAAEEEEEEEDEEL